MAMYCTACGKKFEVDTAYCTDCGAKLDQKTDTVVEPPSFEATPRASVATATPPAVQPTAAPKDNTVGTGVYFGLILLFSLPLIGLIACIVMCFAPKNKNIRNYAKAHLLWSILSLVVTVLLVVMLSTVVVTAMSYLQTVLPSPLADLMEQVGNPDTLKMLLQADDLGDLENLLGQVDWSQIDFSTLDVEGLQPLLEQLGVNDPSELRPLLEQLDVKDLEMLGTLIGQLDANDLNELGTVLEQLEVNDVNELVNLMERYEIDDFNELRNLAAQWSGTN